MQFLMQEVKMDMDTGSLETTELSEIGVICYWSSFG